MTGRPRSSRLVYMLTLDGADTIRRAQAGRDNVTPNTHRNKAVDLLQHYLRRATEGSGGKWSEDHDAEVAEIVDCIVDAATTPPAYEPCGVKHIEPTYQLVCDLPKGHSGRHEDRGVAPRAW